MKASESVVGIILAGGLARRMGGGDKCLLPLAGKTLLQRTIDRASPQVTKLLLNANGNSLRFARTRLPVVPDVFSNNMGPLAGIHAGMNWMEHHAPEADWLVSFASDTPFFPMNFVEMLTTAANSGSTKIAVATSKLNVHPVFALWHISLKTELEALLETGQAPRLQEWMLANKTLKVEFNADVYDPFFNINTPQDLYAAEPISALVK